MRTIKTFQAFRSLCFGCVAAVTIMLSLVACNNEDEVVPLTKENSSTKVYKVPDPELLTADEQADVQSIRDEYRDATN